MGEGASPLVERRERRRVPRMLMQPALSSPRENEALLRKVKEWWRLGQPEASCLLPGQPARRPLEAVPVS